MAKKSHPHALSPQQCRSQSAEYPASAKAPERRHSLPPKSATPGEVCSSPPNQLSETSEEENEDSPSASPDIMIVEERSQPSLMQANGSPSSRPIPVYQSDRTPMRTRKRSRSTQPAETSMASWGITPQSSPNAYPPHCYPESYPVYPPSPMPQPSPLSNLLALPAWPVPSPAHGGPGAYQYSGYAQLPSANHGASYPNALNLQGVPVLGSHAPYMQPPLPYWSYPPYGRRSSRGSPNGGSPMNGQFQPPLDGGQGAYPPTWR